MIEHKEHFHGSDLEKIEQIYGIRKEEITSFSANINPFGISPLLKETLCKHMDAITTYPDRECSALREAIAAYTGAAKEHILVGNGSTELISLFIQITAPKKALLFAPTYSEYEREISLCGGTTYYYQLQEENDFKLDLTDFIQNLDSELDLLVICNPNNPTSSALTNTQMREILAACKKNHTYVLVDETYVEFTEDISLYSSIPLAKEYDNLIVLRGTSKFFAAPGLRLGYAVTGNGSLLEEIHTKKNPWTINSLAAVAGEIMFGDNAYIEKTKSFISSERKRMYDAFNANPAFYVYPAHANFLLVKLLKDELNADLLFDAAIKEKLMIRNCATFPSLNNKFIRFCIMSSDKNDELLSCLFHAAESCTK